MVSGVPFFPGAESRDEALDSQTATMRIVQLVLLLPVFAAVACWPGSPQGDRFEVVRTSPALSAGGAPLLLNDSVTIYFSSPVDPLSVTEDTVTVVDEHGHHVPGSLRTGQNWVTFEPRPPMAPDLGDGSFQPGSFYRLQVAGYPRPDAVRSMDGRRLASAQTQELRIVSPDPAWPDGRSMLRPPSIDLPFVLRHADGLQMLPADAPQLRLHFTLPVLPATATADAFRIRWLGDQEILRPRSVRVINSRFDECPGSSVEIDLGTMPRAGGRDGVRPLKEGDFIMVSVQNVQAPLRDYRGVPVMAALDQCWNVVAGTSISLVTWPTQEGGITGEDFVWPGFEFVSGGVRPRARVEAGDGSLGLFRPRADLLLAPGLPFDRGDGVMVVSRGGAFPFLAIDIPAGVTVRVDGRSGPVAMLAAGGAHIAGTLQIGTGSAPLHVPPHGVAVQELIDNSTFSLVAAGDIRLSGSLEVTAPLASDQTAVTMASAGRIHLVGQLPFNSILAVESTQASANGPSIVGPRGQVTTAVASFTYGMAPGARWMARGSSPWRTLPVDRDGGVVRLIDWDPSLRASWQVAPGHPVRRGEPDLTVGRVGRSEPVSDQERLAVAVGSFLRFHLEADLDAARVLPQMRELRLVDH